MTEDAWRQRLKRYRLPIDRAIPGKGDGVGEASSDSRKFVTCPHCDYVCPPGGFCRCGKTSALDDSAAEHDRLAAEVERLREGIARERMESEQTLGKSLGYPWFKDDPKNFPDATEKDGVCTGEHTACSLADEAAAAIGRLTRERDFQAALAEAYRVRAYDETYARSRDRGSNSYDSTMKATEAIDRIRASVEARFAPKGAPDASA